MQTVKSSPWQPLLEAELRRVALAAVEEIAAELQTRAAETLDCSLASGHAGLAIAFAYFHRWRVDRGFGETSAQHLNLAIDHLSLIPLMPGLHAGFSGIAWAAAHLDRLAGRADETADAFESIDAALEDLLSAESWDRDYDLIGGLAGIGVYALERLPHPAARKCLAGVVEQLARLAETRPAGMSWRTPLHLIPEHRRAERPEGEFNLGLAHGAPGPIAVLAQAAAAGVAVENAADLVDRAVPWLLAQRLSDSPHARFGYDAGPGETRGPARSAWCYGDPGVAAALACAGRARGNSEWEGLAREIALDALDRSEPEMQVADAGLCHGWAGLLQIYNRLFQATGDSRFADFARQCCERTLQARVSGRGIAGYAVWQGGGPDVRWEWKTEVGLLEGVAGIALALLAAGTEISPDWDLTFLISNRALS
jgi:lantibiotic modifying enzyme